SAGRRSCSTAARLDTQRAVHGGSHDLDRCIVTWKEAGKCCGSLLHEHLPSVLSFDAPFAERMYPPCLLRCVHEVERLADAGNVIDVDWRRIVSSESHRRRIDRDIDFHSPNGDLRLDADRSPSARNAARAL